MEIAVLDKVRSTLAAAGFRGWRLEWTSRDVCQRVLNGERVAVVSLRGWQVNILQGDTWKIDDATWVVTSVDTMRSTCLMSGPLPCRGMQVMALSYVVMKGTLVRRNTNKESVK